MVIEGRGRNQAFRLSESWQTTGGVLSPVDEVDDLSLFRPVLFALVFPVSDSDEELYQLFVEVALDRLQGGL